MSQLQITLGPGLGNGGNDDLRSELTRCFLDYIVDLLQRPPPSADTSKKNVNKNYCPFQEFLSFVVWGC